MKIVHCLGFFDPRFFFREKYYTSELAKIPGNEVHILTSTYGIPQAKMKIEYPAGTEVINNVTVHRVIPRAKWKDMVFLQLNSIMQLIKPDIVHLYDGRQVLPYFVAKYCVKNNIPYIYEHEQRYSGERFVGKLRSRLVVLPMITKIVKSAAQVRAVTPGAIDFISDRIPRTTPVNVATLAYDQEVSFFSQQIRNQIRSQYHLSDQTLVIGCTGRFDTVKKIDVVIKAFLNCKRNDLVLFLVGTGQESYLSYLKSLYLTHSKKDKIIFFEGLLNQSKLNEVFNGLDYAIWTKPTISFFEAIAAGCQIIIPYGRGCSHLNGSAILFFGEHNNIDPSATQINNDNIAIEELTARFELLTLFNKSDMSKDAGQFEKKTVVRKLYEDYLLIVKKKCV